MRIKENIYKILIIALLAVAGIFLFYRHTSRKSEAKNFLERVRAKNKLGLDSLQNSISNENALYARIEEKINQKDFRTASSLIDSLFTNDKKHIAHVYRGMIYAKQLNFPKAIEEYNTAIEQDKFSLALSKRAEVYIAMNKLDLAMADYKKIYGWNYDYSFQIASVFELKKMKDSALKYYSIYSGHYPDDQAALLKIKSLKSN